MTRLEKLHKAIGSMENHGIPANEWRIDTAKSGIGFPRLYIPVEYREKNLHLPTCAVKYGDYIYGR